MHEKIWCKNGQQMGAAKRAGPSSLLYFQKKASAGDDRHMTRAMSDDYEHGTRATAGAPNLNHGMVIRFHLFTIWGFLIEIDQCFHAKSLYLFTLILHQFPHTCFDPNLLLATQVGMEKRKIE
jgi:hypothetical protein